MNSLKEIASREIRMENRNIKELHVETKGKNVYQLCTSDGQILDTTPRFWSSFNRLHKINDKLYNLFSREEVFNRVAANRGGSMQIAIEENLAMGTKKALSATPAGKGILTADSVLDILFSQGAVDVRYENGRVQGFISPDGDKQLKIGPDDFKMRNLVSIPVDGYGLPSITVSLLRLICMNGMVGLDNAFSSDIKLGGGKNNEEIYNLSRGIEAFSNERAQDLLVRRLDNSRNSVASLSEIEKAKFALIKAGVEAKYQRPLEKAIYEVLRKHGVATINNLTDKQKRLVQSNLSVYDMINLMTEISTHKVEDVKSKTMIQGHVGEFITKEFDLEGIGSDKTQYVPLFFAS